MKMRDPKHSLETMSGCVRKCEHLDRDARVSVSLPVMLETAPDQPFPATVVDLSQNGFRLISSKQLEAGQLVRLHCRNEVAVAEIRWVDGPESGGSFAEAAKVPEW